MLRLSLLILASFAAFNSYAQLEDSKSINGQTSNEAVQNAGIAQEGELLEELEEYTELEYQLIESSGLLSLSQQVKYSAQHLISLSVDRPDDQTELAQSNNRNTDDNATPKVVINHAQHFAIAKNLSKSWTEEVWQQRLLELVHRIPLETQLRIQQQLSQPMLQAAQRKERAAISVQHSPEYLLYMNKLRQRPPAASRWQLVENLDKQSGFSQLIIQVRAAVNQEIQKQVEGWQPEEFWKNQTRQEVLEFLFYAYRKTPNAELKHIADSFNQAELSQFYRDVYKIIQ